MRGRFAMRLGVRVRRWVLPLVGAFLITNCTTASTPTDPTTPGPTPRVSSTDAPTGATGMPPSELAVAGIAVAQSMGDDPALKVSVRRPVAPGQVGLSSAIAGWATSAESAFRGDYVANPEAPPELNVGWQVVTASGPVLGIRMETFEFGGASGQTSHRVFYGDGSDTWTGADLIAESARASILARVLAAVSAQGHPTLGPGPSGEPGETTAQDVLSDVTITAAGDVVVLLDQGAAAPHSSGNLRVTIPSADAVGMLSERGRRVAQAVRSGLPYAVSVPSSAAPTAGGPSAGSGGSTATPPPAPPTPPASGPVPAASVDCAVLKCVALTFDDGPGPLTGRLLDSLVSAGAPATFFVLGQNVRIHPDVVARMVRSGMVVANHTWDHRDLKRLTLEESRSEVDRTAAEITRVTGTSTILMRPPYGSYAPQTTTLGQSIILWDVDTEDWKNRSAAVTTSRALATVRSGSIILMHDIHASTVEAVPGIVAALKARGFTLVTIPQLLGSTTPGKVYTRRTAG
ncbi:MAG: polysaccharide deacetylase family protein [Candidatus Phosphoribacter baldrii]